MVLLPLDGAPDGWELLRGAASSSLETLRGVAHSSSAASAGPVLLFVAAGDVDALAAVRVLTALLKADLARYEVHPVSGYAHLRDKYSVLARGPEAVEPRAVLCVNCGAAVDLERVLGLRGKDGEMVDETDVRVFVMDCHRPYHLKNIRSRRVVLFDDVNNFKQEELPLDVDWEDEWGNVAEDSSDESESESEEESESDLSADEEEADEEAEEAEEAESPGHEKNDTSPDEDPDTVPETPDEGHELPQPTKQKRKRRVRDKDLEAIEQDDVLFDDEGSSPGPEDDEEDEPIKKSRSKSRPRKKLRRNRRRHSRYGGDPEAEERERLREYYAHASIAMSSAALSHSIAAVLRRSNINTLWMAILGVTSQYISFSITDALYEDAYAYFQQQIDVINPRSENGEEGTSREQSVGFACKATHVQRIAPNVEVRLDLLRHWSLYDSLLYSSYTATRLAAWRQTGRRRLLEMLATLGIPLKESQQQWCYMQHKNKKALEDNLHKAMMRFDLGESLQYDSFVRSMPGHKGDIAAADYAHAISALLEFEDPSRKDRPGHPSSSLISRFWRAYDALDCHRTANVETGLEMAISVQKLTADIAGDVIERRKFVPSGPFRYVFLRDQQSKEYLSHPLLLRRLALFLTKALIRQGAKEKPFVVLAPDVARDVWIAVAATTPGQRNDFGHRFQKAAERNGSQVTYDGFDSSVCEIRDGQEVEFVRFLHDVMR